MTLEKPKIGRPPKPIDWTTFEKLCHLQCTHDEIASFFHITKDTLYDRALKEYEEDAFSTIYKRFAEGGKSSLRRYQFKLAEKNTAMAIWLGKNWLGQKDREETINNGPTKVVFEVNYGAKDKVEILPQTLPASDSSST